MSDFVYVWVCDDRGRGEEIVAGGLLPGTYPMPLMSVHLALAKRMKPLAEAHARKTGKPVKLVQFLKREVVDEIKP